MAKDCKGCIHRKGFHTGDTERFCMYAYDQYEFDTDYYMTFGKNDNNHKEPLNNNPEAKKYHN